MAQAVAAVIVKEESREDSGAIEMDSAFFNNMGSGSYSIDGHSSILQTILSQQAPTGPSTAHLASDSPSTESCSSRTMVKSSSSSFINNFLQQQMQSINSLLHSTTSTGGSVELPPVNGESTSIDRSGDNGGNCEELLPTADIDFTTAQIKPLPTSLSSFVANVNNGIIKSSYGYRKVRLHPSKCDQCSKMFNSPSHLKRHQLIHLAIRPFPCSFCGKTFYRKDKMKMHEKTHIRKTCQVCGQMYERVYDLNAHIRETGHDHDIILEQMMLGGSKTGPKVEKMELNHPHPVDEAGASGHGPSAEGHLSNHSNNENSYLAQLMKGAFFESPSSNINNGCGTTEGDNSGGDADEIGFVPDDNFYVGAEDGEELGYSSAVNGNDLGPEDQMSPPSDEIAYGELNGNDSSGISNDASEQQLNEQPQQQLVLRRAQQESPQQNSAFSRHVALTANQQSTLAAATLSNQKMPILLSRLVGASGGNGGCLTMPSPSKSLKNSNYHIAKGHRKPQQVLLDDDVVPEQVLQQPVSQQVGSSASGRLLLEVHACNKGCPRCCVGLKYALVLERKLATMEAELQSYREMFEDLKDSICSS